MRSARVLVSICIPVHNTEAHLGRCLESVASQNFPSLEVVLINDRSTGKDEKGRKCKKIVRSFEKKTKIPVKFIEHFRYVPLLETRRELIENARGEYILNVDSDDFLAPGAVQTLYDSALQSAADITCGTERIYKISGQDGSIQISEKRYAVYKEGVVHDREIFDSFIVRHEISAFLWAKLIKREVFLDAMNEIPFMDSSLSVDTPMFFFIALHSKKYVGINNVVYYYLEDEGITTSKPITNLESWRRHCTVASIYSFLLTYEGSFTEEEKEGIRANSRFFLYNSVLRLKNQVIPPLRPEARRMLCEWWGEHFVETVEKAVDEKSAQTE